MVAASRPFEPGVPPSLATQGLSMYPSHSFLPRSITPHGRTAKRRSKPQRKVLAAEPLESRQLLATYTANFGDLALDPESHWDGPDPVGTGSPVAVGSFRSGGVVFRNKYNIVDNYWVSNFAYSNETDTATPGFANPYSSFAGGGNGDANFGLSYGYFTGGAFNPANLSHLDALPSFSLPIGADIQSAFITNTTWTALSMRDGDAVGKKFGGVSGDDPDWCKITAYGVDENGTILAAAPEFYLADFRNPDNTQDYILNTWQQFDLSSLAGARKLFFYFTSSDVHPVNGLNTPAYFAIDDIVYTGPANTAPTLNTTPNPQLGDIHEDEPNAMGVLVSDLFGGAVSDPDVGAVEGMAIVGTSTAGGIWQYSLDGGTTWLDLGTPSEDEARLLPSDSLTRIRFVPDNNFSGELTISYRAWDQTEGTPGGVLSTAGRTGGSGTFSAQIETAIQTIDSVNDAPVLDNTPTPVFPTILEDTTKPSGMFVADLVTGAISDDDPGAEDGIGVISAPSNNGTWQYTLDGTTFNPIWKSIGPLISPEGDNLARLLLADAKTKIRFVPKKDFNGEVSIRFQAWDHSEGEPGQTLPTATRIGGDKCFSLNYDDAAITVTPVNDAPVLDNTLTPSLGSILEDAKNPSGTLIKYLARNAITDVDENADQGLAIVSAYGGNGDWQFSLDSITWQSMTGASESAARLLPVDETTRVRFVPKADYFGDAWISYRAWDQTEGNAGETLSTQGRQGLTKTFSTAKEAVKITITAINDAPVVSLSGTVGYVRNDPAIVLAPFARVTDVDNANFAGGRLKVRIDSGKSNFNLLAIGAGFTVDETLKVRQGTTHIGNLNPGGGDGTTDLIVTFNSSATKAIVQDLVRAITFRTLGGSAGTRSIKFSVSDGKGGVSAEATKTVNVT